MALRLMAGRAMRAGQTQAFVKRSMNDGDRQLGDYPTLPFRTRQFEDPFKHWDKQDRRDREQTLHEQDEVIGQWTYDQDPHVSKWEALGSLLLVFGGLGALTLAASQYNAPSKKPTAQRTLPFENA